jgi:hypothetical protein
MNRLNMFPRRPRTKKRWRPNRAHPQVELLEARNLLSTPPTNVLVNNPAEDTIPMQDTQNETAIVLGANSKIVVAYNDDGTFSYPTPLNPTTAGYSLSTNAGASFTDQGQLPSSGPYWAWADQALARSSKTGTILLSDLSVNLDTVSTPAGGLGERVNIYRSLDNGASFLAPLNGTPGFVPGVDVADKPWIAEDNYPGPGYGNTYLTWTDIDAVTGIQKAIEFTSSTDDGVTWGPSGGTPIFSPGSNGGAAFALSFVTVGPDHAVYVFWWDDTKGPAILMRKSTDHGQTFADSVIVTGLKTHGYLGNLGLTASNTNSSSFRTSVFPQAAVNPATGDIYVVYNDQGNGSADKADIFFTMSTDGGKHWSKPLRVNDDNTYTDQWQPAFATTPDGTHLFITWYDRRNDPTNDSLIDRYGVIGTVSGHTVSFAPNFRITDVSFPPAFNQDSFFATGGYMGDYDMATADNNYFYTTWGDNRLPDQWFANQPDVRFAKISVSQDDSANLALAASSRVVPGTSGTGQSTAGSLNNSASLLVEVANSMAAQAPANPRPLLPASQSGGIVQPVPASPPAAPMDGSAGQVPGPSVSQLNPATAMKALNLVFADEGEDGLSDGLSLAVIGS